jgi:hypothetical protein
MDCLKNIVVGVDFSSFSRCALKQAARVALWNEAKLHILHVVDTSVVNRLQEFWSAKRALLESKVTYERIRDSATRQLEEQVGDARNTGMHLDAITGAPFVELLRRVPWCSPWLARYATVFSGTMCSTCGTVFSMIETSSRVMPYSTRLVLA